MAFHLHPLSKIAVVIAHPDDEALGCGGTIAKLSSAGHSVHVVLALRRTDSRGTREWQNALCDFERSCQILGATGVILDPLMDQEFAEPQVHILSDALLPEIERADVIFTHWPADVNQAHRGVSRAVEIATRPFRRQKPVVLFEVSTSTEQGYIHAFTPNLYVSLDRPYATRKCEAVEFYRSERAPGRTNDTVLAKLVTRGAEIGCEYAEAFHIARAFL
jgi:LmbE family N-acetylglucosaminyl deacetylase